MFEGDRLTEPRVTPHVLIDTQHGHTVEACRVVDEPPVPFGQDRVVRGLPRHPQLGCGTGDRLVVDHEGAPRPRQPTAGDLRAGLGSCGRVLRPEACARGAPVAASWACHRTVHERVCGSRCPAGDPDHHRTDTRRRRHGTRAPPDLVGGVGPQSRARVHQGGRTWSGRARRR